MADTDVAAPAATESAPAPATGQEQQDTRPTGTTPREVQKSARAQVHELGTKFAEQQAKAREARHHSANQPRAEDGKFTEAEAAPAATDSEALAVSATGEATTPPAADGPPEGMVRIEYPEGHPLRAQGETHIDVPAAYERSARTMVNSAARRQEAEAAERRAQEERAARLRVEAELKFVREQGSSFWTPEHQATYDDLLRAYGQEAADAYKRGQQQKAEGAMAQVREGADLEAITEHWQTKGNGFRAEAVRALPEQFPGLQPHEIETAIGFYAMEIKRVQDEAWSVAQRTMSRAEFERRWAAGFDYSADDFFKVAGDYLKTRPGVIAAQGQQQAAQQLRENQIRAETEAAKRQELIEASKRHATNPQRGLGGVSTPGSGTTNQPDAPDRHKQSPDQIRRSMRDEVRELGNRVGKAITR